ncbi:MAG: ATP-binding protein [Cyclobacteriaceae bacterium]
MKRHILITIFLISFLAVHGQKDQIRFKEYGVKEGLPEEVALTIYEDTQGYIWIATQNGLVKFDGYTMRTFGPNQGKQGEALQIKNLFGGLFQGRDEKIWIAGGSSDKSGMAIYNPKDQSFENIMYHPDSSVLIFNSVRPMHEDLNNNIWFRNYSSELDSTILVKYNPASKKTSIYRQDASSFRLQYTENIFFSENNMDSSIWIFDFHSNHLKKYDALLDTFRTVFEPGETYSGYTLPDSLYGVFPKNTGHILFGYYGKVFVADQITGTIVKAYEFDFEKRTPENVLSFNFYFWLDTHKLLWISSGNYLTVYNISNDQKQTFEFGKPPLEEAPNNINTLIPTFEDQENLYFGVLKDGREAYLRFQYSDSSFYYYDEYFNHDDNRLVLKDYPAVFHKDFSGTRWLGTRPNLYQEQKSNIQSYSKFGVPEREIDSLTFPFEDSKGRVWVSFVGGMLLKEPNKEEFKIFDADKGDFPFRGVSKSLEDNDGTIWVKSFGNSGGGLARYNEQTASFEQIGAGFNTNSFSFDKKRKHLWVSNEAGIFAVSKKGEVLYQLDAELTRGFSVGQYFHDSQGNTWISDEGNNEHAILLLDDKDSLSVIKQIRGDSTSLSSNGIRFITEDNFNNIWIGTNAGGLNKYSNGTIERVKSGSFTGHSIDKNNNMWFTTYASEGLVSVSPESGRAVGYGLDEGMLHTDDIVYNYHNNRKIATDQDGRMYILNKRGLSIFNPSTKEFTNLETSDALTENLYNTTSISLSNGEIWFMHRQGLEIIDPKKIFEDKNTIPPKVWITSMTIMDSVYSAPDGDIFTKSVDFTDKIQLEYWQKNLGFEFVALHYLKSEDNQYSWKLEGHDENWSKPSLTRKISYTNLSPGTYTFRVKGSNADGVWNEEGDYIKIIIKPPFWLSAGAYVFYFIVLGFAIFGVHRFQKARIIRMEQARVKDQQLAQAKEIKKAYSELQQTQTQLIHSEKMASLGELTAGIAHEIQNPLNFVNNFSDLNRELLDELKEAVAQNDQEEVADLIKDLSANEIKINHHGKRAEEIVKSMLMHSRTGSGEKELTDINALADEYLRLSYHGLRAKDKSFNADFKAELDPELPKINVIPQDIGRVILNLINNSFQAVRGVEKPEVIVSTKRIPLAPFGKGDADKSSLEGGRPDVSGNDILITISDNGSGIPESIKDKIFQPFFTTKAAGEGTGLGLSMSYDIVTKGHGGTIEVQSEEGQGTKFIIALPVILPK